VQRRATATGGERDEDEETEDQKRERTGPQGPNWRLLALPLHSWREPTEGVGFPPESENSGVAADEQNCSNNERNRRITEKEQ
jgi:hypothetical protein